MKISTYKYNNIFMRNMFVEIKVLNALNGFFILIVSENSSQRKLKEGFYFVHKSASFYKKRNNCVSITSKM